MFELIKLKRRCAFFFKDSDQTKRTSIGPGKFLIVVGDPLSLGEGSRVFRAVDPTGRRGFVLDMKYEPIDYE